MNFDNKVDIKKKNSKTFVRMIIKYYYYLILSIYIKKFGWIKKKKNMAVYIFVLIFNIL